MGIFALSDNHLLCQWIKIQEYIKNQLKEDELADQMSIKEYFEPFTGEEYPRNKSKQNPFTDRKKT